MPRSSAAEQLIGETHTGPRQLTRPEPLQVHRADRSEIVTNAGNESPSSLDPSWESLYTNPCAGWSSRSVPKRTRPQSLILWMMSTCGTVQVNKKGPPMIARSLIRPTLDINSDGSDGYRLIAGSNPAVRLRSNGCWKTCRAFTSFVTYLNFGVGSQERGDTGDIWPGIRGVAPSPGITEPPMPSHRDGSD
jgi:hypothetical protein